MWDVKMKRNPELKRIEDVNQILGKDDEYINEKPGEVEKK